MTACWIEQANVIWQSAFSVYGSTLANDFIYGHNVFDILYYLIANFKLVCCDVLASPRKVKNHHLCKDL